MSEPIKRDLFDGRTISVVGNSERILDNEWGEQIDAADLVVRFNWALPNPDNASKIGTRCSFMVTANSIAKRERRSGSMNEFRSVWPEAILVGRSPSQFLHYHFSTRLIEKSRLVVRAEPSSGILALFFMSNECAPEKVSVFGFDGLQSRVWYRSGPKHSNRHRKNGEARALQILDRNPKIEFFL